VHVTSLLVVDTLVNNDHLGAVAAPLEANDHVLRLCLFHAPRVRERVRRFDSLELAADPDDATVGKAIRDPVLTADPQVDVCVNTLDILRSPPVLELCGPRPRIEEALRCGADRLSNDKPDYSPST
jgi:hypothetical protein